MIQEKFANQFTRELYYVATTPEDAINYLKSYKEPDKVPSKHEIYSR